MTSKQAPAKPAGLVSLWNSDDTIREETVNAQWSHVVVGCFAPAYADRRVASQEKTRADWLAEPHNPNLREQLADRAAAMTIEREDCSLEMILSRHRTKAAAVKGLAKLQAYAYCGVGIYDRLQVAPVR